MERADGICASSAGDSELYGKNSDELVSFEDYEDLSPEEKLEIERELYKEKQLEAGVAPEDITDVPDEIKEQVGVLPQQAQNSQAELQQDGTGEGEAASDAGAQEQSRYQHFQMICFA